MMLGFLPTRITQAFPVMVQHFLTTFLGNPASIKPPMHLRLLSPSPSFVAL